MTRDLGVFEAGVDSQPAEFAALNGMRIQGAWAWPDGRSLTLRLENSWYVHFEYVPGRAGIDYGLRMHAGQAIDDAKLASELREEAREIPQIIGRTFTGLDESGVVTFDHEYGAVFTRSGIQGVRKASSMGAESTEVH